MAVPDPKVLAEIASKMGLNALDAGTFIGRVTVNPQVAGVIADAAGGGKGGSIDPKYNQFLKTMGDKYKQDPGFVAKLNDDLKANPGLKDKLSTAIKNHPNLAAEQVAAYQAGQLGQSVSRLEDAISKQAASATTADAAAAAETARLAARTRSSTPAPAATAAATTAPAQTTTAPQTAAAAPPAASTPPASSAPAAAAGAPAIDATAIQAAAAAEVMKTLATASDEKIKELMTPDMVKNLASGVAAYSHKHYPEMDADAQAFVAEAGAEGLSKRIAENLQRNPQLIRDLAKTMNEEPNPNDPLKDIKKSGVRDALKQIYAQPEKLADENFTENLARKFQMAEGGMGGMLKGLLGNDMGGLGGIINGIGAFFQGIMNWFGNAISAFSSGNFSLLRNLNPGMGMTEAFIQSSQRAENIKGLEENASVIPRSQARGPINGNGKVIDDQGKPVMDPVKDEQGKVIGQRQRMDDSFDHRVEYGGHKFYLTNGLQPAPVIHKDAATGQNRWVVADNVDANGRVRGVKEIVLSDADSAKLMDRLERDAKAAGTKLNFSTPIEPKEHKQANITEYSKEKGQVVREITVSSKDAANDQSYGAETQPVRPGVAEPRPLDDTKKPAANDAEWAIKMGG